MSHVDFKKQLSHLSNLGDGHVSLLNLSNCHVPCDYLLRLDYCGYERFCNTHANLYCFPVV